MAAKKTFEKELRKKRNACERRNHSVHYMGKQGIKKQSIRENETMQKSPNSSPNSFKLVKAIALLLALIFVLVISSSSAASLGISPARTTIEFEPNTHKDISLRVLNSDMKDLRILVFAQGELAQYVKIPKGIVEIKSSESEVYVAYSVDLPSSIETPGVHEAQITIVELPKTEGNVVLTESGNVVVADETGATITATASVKSQLKVNVPYPGKYADANLFISEANVGGSVFFTVSLYNFGAEDIQKAKAQIKILSPTNLEIASIESNEISLKSKESSKVSAEWKADVNPGPYHAIIVLDYDGKKIRLEQNFNVGNIALEIKKIEVSSFRLGEIAKFEISLESKWGEPLSSVYGDVTITDSRGNDVSKFKTGAVDVPAFSGSKISSYWDTKGLAIGSYSMKVVLNFAGKTAEKVIELTVNADSIAASLTPTALAISKSSANSGFSSRDTILLAVIIILVVINIGWFVYIKKIRKTQQ